MGNVIPWALLTGFVGYIIGVTHAMSAAEKAMAEEKKRIDPGKQNLKVTPTATKAASAFVLSAK